MEQPATPDTATIKVPKRAYQACIRCRRRKARCIVSEPTPGEDPVCLKCKRERKQCVFTAERSRKQVERLSQQSLQTEETSQNRPRTRRIGEGSGSTSASPGWNHHPRATPHQESTAGQGAPITSPVQDDSPLSELTDRVTRTTVSNQVEALNLLFEAAEVYHTKVAPTAPGVDVVEPLMDVDPDIPSIQANSFNSPRRTEGWLYPAENVAQPSEESIQTFSKLKFVRKKWLTAQEAITYVELFYKNMKSLSPIVDDHYGHPHNFRALVDEEPVLCTTILTLSSRYHMLHGDGWLSRSYFLHNRLWRYCHSLLQRVIWGQEKCVVSSARSLGTVEGLLLMAEWHARSLHLPPDTEAWDSDDDNPKRDGTNVSAHIPNRWLEGVVEPMRRSDRMSWALIQSAASLAQELEIFDQAKDDMGGHVSDAASRFTKRRRQRLRVLLYVYINQLAFRIGFSSLIPHNLVNVSPNEFKKTSVSGPTDQWVDLMSLWVDLTGLVRISHDLLFSSKAVTRDLVLSGGYRRILGHFKPMLENWWEKYTALNVHGPLRDLLCIDFQYTRIYIYSLALQAAAERKMSHQPADAVPQGDLPSILDYPYEDYGFVQDVVGGAKEVLRVVLAFAEAGRLRYLPVRTYVRVISTCIFLLKALALGVPADQLNTSLGLIDQSARVLRLHTVDDLHLAGIFASLLETYTQGFRARFVSILKVPRSSAVWAEMGSPPAGTQADDSLGSDIATGTADEYEINHDWFAHPFDSSIAPFGVGFTQPFGVFDDDLNFIWNEIV